MARDDGDGVWWWGEAEAEEVSASQLATSACGPTALLDVLRMLLGSTSATPEAVLAVCPARVRDYTVTLLKYLESRATAGTTHVDLLSAARHLSGGQVTGRLFAVPALLPGASLCAWLAAWMRAGAVPMATMNLFLEGGDAWHHQIVYGVTQPPSEPPTLHLLNPVSKMSPEQLVTCTSGTPFMIIPRDHMERKVVQLLRCGNSSSPSATPAADVLGLPAPAATPESPLQHLRQLCRHLDSMAPWSHFRTGTQLAGVAHLLLQELAAADEEGCAAQSDSMPDVEALASGSGGPHQSSASPGDADRPTDSPETSGSRRRTSAAAQHPYAAYSRCEDVVIPWGGLGGVTMFVRVGSLAHTWLQAKPTVCVPLPLYGTTTHVSLDMQPGVEEASEPGSGAGA